ncbi:nitrite reductase large subunit NirB [Mesobacillus foraminis]|uniref:Nitrite reductase (NADH) large subunit n=1 Tax=Mesobacillus foraminis TaxID=279826 RepID=A0A4R2BI19_9BACI|nr:nitrite reductase large subunit NirB [Mesobacillus foraminis]TCN26777.1 nitrite reductase (NADH) large subunit [Mesobacillus foraminis]
MRKQRLVLVGNGMAGVRCIEEILKHDADAFEITIFGSENHGNYNRIMLSSVLQGNAEIDEIILQQEAWYQERGIRLFKGETVVSIDPPSQTVRSDQGREVSYDKLILATGSSPFILPIKGVDKKGVRSFRTIEDCERILSESRSCKAAAVIGGGLLGLEAAKGLLNLGLKVQVIHKAPFLMERQLDETASKMLQAELERQGMSFIFEKHTQEFAGKDRVERIQFSDGTGIDAELVVMAVGVRPNVGLARDHGIAVNRGIIVNEYMQSSDPAIYAVGECAESNGIVYGIVKPLYEQGKVLAKHLCGIASDGYKGSVLSTQLKISGVDVFSIGQLDGGEEGKAVTIFNSVDGVYKKMVFQENKLVGVVLYGDTTESGRLLELIVKRKDVEDLEKGLLLSSAQHEGYTTAGMPPTDVICNCNGVSKGTIVEACLSKNLATVEQVKECTKASGSCGGCRPLVADLLDYVHSDEFDEPAVVGSLCSCTNLTEDEIVRQIQEDNLQSTEQAMAKLGWNNPRGCGICVPALRYYLGMVHPAYKASACKAASSPGINAVLQDDGTYSVVPRMYGGVTDANQLKGIAQVIEKYNIPEVRLTSGQRIQLAGIKEEILDEVLRELTDILVPAENPKRSISSVPWGNASLKTFVADQTCGCSRNESVQLAAELERKTESLNMPASLKIGISPCQHCDAAATAMDIGLIHAQGRWEVYVGGQTYRNVSGGALFYVTGSPEEIFEITLGLIQYYRETANYLEPTWKWVERLGLIHIREILFDQDIRMLLLKRLESEREQQSGANSAESLVQ